MLGNVAADNHEKFKVDNEKIALPILVNGTQFNIQESRAY